MKIHILAIASILLTPFAALAQTPTPPKVAAILIDTTGTASGTISNPLTVSVSGGSGGGAGATTTAAAPTYTEGATNQQLSADLSGYQRVRAKQDGSWSMGITGTIPVSGTFWQATQPVSNASLPLPTGASTSAKQDSLLAAVGSPFQAGGSVGVSGTLPAFAAIPAFKIDQTTPGTTNAVLATNFPATVATGTGAQGATSPRLTVATDAATIAGSAPGTAGTASTNVISVQGVTSGVAVPVSGNVGISGNVTVLASSNTIGYISQSLGYTDTTTALGASATFTGTARQSVGYANTFTAVAYADQAGTFTIEMSLNSGTNYYTVASVMLVAGTASILNVPIVGANSSATLFRVKIVNGAVAQTVLQVASCVRSSS